MVNDKVKPLSKKQKNVIYDIILENVKNLEKKLDSVCNSE